MYDNLPIFMTRKGKGQLAAGHKAVDGTTDHVSVSGMLVFY